MRHEGRDGCTEHVRAQVNGPQWLADVLQCFHARQIPQLLPHQELHYRLRQHQNARGISVSHEMEWKGEFERVSMRRT